MSDNPCILVTYEVSGCNGMEESYCGETVPYCNTVDGCVVHIVLLLTGIDQRWLRIHGVDSNAELECTGNFALLLLIEIGVANYPSQPWSKPFSPGGIWTIPTEPQVGNAD